MERLYDDMPDFSVLIGTRLSQLQEEDGSTAKDFAKKIGIPEPTLTRYKQGKCNTDSHHAKAMLGIVVSDPERYAELMIHYFPKDSEVWRKIFAEHRFSGSQGGMSIHALVRKDSLYYYIYSFAGLDRGLPLSVVETCWGLLGMERLQHLVDGELLRIEGETVFRDNKTHNYGDLETTKQNVGYLIHDFPLANIHEQTGSLINLLNNLNDRGVQRIRKLSNDYGNAALDVLQSPEYRGTTPVCVCLFSGKMKHGDVYKSAVEDLGDERNESPAEEKR